MLLLAIAVQFQATVATQAHPSFDAAYSGRNSMQPGAESATSVVSDLLLSQDLWPGAQVQLEPELSGGRGLSQTLGVAAFPSGEVYRVGEVAPGVHLARVSLQQKAGELTITAGRIAVTDFVDSVPLSNDPHTRFMSWGLWASAAYDYPADTRGYTWGVAADYTRGDWSGRLGAFLEPKTANGLDLEWNVTRARGLVAEGERRFEHGAVRALAFLNTADMGSYDQAVQMSAPDVTATRAQGRTKYGFAASANCDCGGFVRASWNDGANETWAFTEIDRSLAAGFVQPGARWGREQDEAGAGVVISGLSHQHRRYLESGGYGFLIGDGALHYAPEILAEVWYRAALTKEVSFAGHYQPIINPGFNRDRGPIHVFTGMVHVAF
ncbi:MAG TPA: carbohydrate porin [Myxococcales bacterium]|nr:carbohydrate porin [Myxococcales bacterium]